MAEIIKCFVCKRDITTEPSKHHEAEIIAVRIYVNSEVQSVVDMCDMCFGENFFRKTREEIRKVLEEEFKKRIN